MKIDIDRNWHKPNTARTRIKSIWLPEQRNHLNYVKKSKKLK
jgi:hypothetical protein